MSYLKEALLKKEKELKNIIVRTKESLKDAPEGHLRISQSGKKVQYYYRSQETDGPYKTGKYIRKENQQLAYRLAQRDYEKKLLKVAENRLASVQKLLKDYEADELQKVYEQMNPYRKDIVIPKVITDKMFVEQWKKVEFQGKSFAQGSAEIYTEKGERVRSKSEKIIADMLYRHRIPYRYEYPITLQGIGMVYPDFTILDVKRRQEVYWEHLGMMDNPEYCERALYKLNCYTKNDTNPFGLISRNFLTLYLVQGIGLVYNSSRKEGKVMKIGDVSKETGLSISNIRFYEKKGLLEPKRSQISKYREYSAEDIERLKQIILLRKMDFSIENCFYNYWFCGWYFPTDYI